MSTKPPKTIAPEPTASAPASPEQNAEKALTDLMARGDNAKAAAPASTARGPDLEQQALRAAQAAIAESEQALATADAQLRSIEVPAKTGRRRELVLRVLLAVNVMAMLIVASLPTRSATDSQRTPPHAAPELKAPAVEPIHAPIHKEPYNRALEAADRGDFAAAVAALEGYLAASPRLAPGQQLNVLLALAYYAARNNDFKKSQDYQRRAEAIERSHSLPEDLVAMAKAALDNGDQETLRRVWARFLLQQRQIPSWLYKHVAEAYLQLGDSYREQANSAAEQARLSELERAAQKLRDEAVPGGGKK